MNGISVVPPGQKAAVGESALVMLVAAYFLRQQAMDPRLLERHDEFRRLVLDRFVDEATASFADGSDRETAKKLLPVIAALQPIAPARAELRSAVAGFV